MAFVIGDGLYDYYQNKKIEVEGLAKVLAHNAALNYTEVVAEQVSLSMKNDPTLEDIDFYTADEGIVFDHNPENDWKNALFNTSMNIHQDVVSTGLPSQNVLTLNQYGIDKSSQSPVVSFVDPEHKSTNTTLIGHISIIVDLKQLRIEWFRSNAVIIAILCVFFMILISFIYWRLRFPLITLSRVAKQADKALEKGEVDINPLSISGKRFPELNSFYELILLLVKQYQVLVAKYDTLRKEDAKYQGRRQSASQNSSFQSMVIHELKNSLFKIGNGLKSIESQYISNEQANAVATIRNGVNDLEVTLGQIVQLNRIESGQVSISISELYPIQLIDDLVQKYKPQTNKKGLELITNIRHIDTILAGDESKIRRILEELISNAVKYTDAGSITIDSRINYFKEIVRWTVEVSDTGIGIDSKHIDDVFIPFFKASPTDETRNKGNGNGGIGLGVAYKLTQLLDGELTVDSVEGKGSTFTLVLQVRDWRLHKTFKLLEGIKILTFEQDCIDTTGLTNAPDSFKNLEAYGASVTITKDIHNLIEKFNTLSVKVITIAEYTPYDLVRYLCLTVRQQEVSQRVLIIWLKDGLSQEKLADLEALGLDYVMSPLLSYEAQARVLKKWL